MIRLADSLHPDRVVDLKSRTKEAALLELTETFKGCAEVLDREKVLDAIRERERHGSTGIGLGVAVPHAKIPEVTDFVLAYGRSREGIDFDAMDARPVHHVVVIVGPPDRQARYLQYVAAVTLTLKRAELRRSLELASGPEELRRILTSA